MTDKMVEDLVPRFNKWLLMSCVAELPPEQLPHLKVLMDKDGYDEEEFSAFMSIHVPNFHGVLQKALQDFRKSYVGD